MEGRDLSSRSTQEVARDQAIGDEPSNPTNVQKLQAALRAVRRDSLSESRMREIRTSGSMSGRWKRSMVALVRHRPTKGPATDRLDLRHRATSRLYSIATPFLRMSTLSTLSASRVETPATALASTLGEVARRSRTSQSGQGAMPHPLPRLHLRLLRSPTNGWVSLIAFDCLTALASTLSEVAPRRDKPAGAGRNVQPTSWIALTAALVPDKWLGVFD